jgi:MarR family transcriptional regulator, temperature-dependent positive regulator of motility
MIEQAPPDPAAQDAHLRLMSLIEKNPDYSQRRLAEAMGVSLGKTHYLLVALLDRGLVRAGRFRRSANKLGYVYILTPAGIRHRMQLARRFLQLKEQEYVSLKHEIEQLKQLLEVAPSSDRPGDSTS